MSEEKAKQHRRRKLAKKPVTVREKADKAQAKKAKEQKKKAPKKPSKTAAKASQAANNTKSFLNKSLDVHDHDHEATGIKASLTKQRSIIPSYFSNSVREIQEVTWPSFKEAWSLTFAVVMFAVVFAILVSSLDWVLGKVFEEVILNESQNIREYLQNLF